MKAMRVMKVKRKIMNLRMRNERDDTHRDECVLGLIHRVSIRGCFA
jgi:hypothetical protein